MRNDRPKPICGCRYAADSRDRHGRPSADHDVFFRILHGILAGAVEHSEGHCQQAYPADKHEQNDQHLAQGHKFGGGPQGEADGGEGRHRLEGVFEKHPAAVTRVMTLEAAASGRVRR